jgi:hypothetical protein
MATPIRHHETYAHLLLSAALLASLFRPQPLAAQSCEARQLLAAAKYSSCRLKNASKSFKHSSPPDYEKCDRQLNAAFNHLIEACSDQKTVANVQVKLTQSADNTINYITGAGPRFVDNFDGTITDRFTDLMWEKKVQLDGVPVLCTSKAQCPNPHDADNRYNWSTEGEFFDGPAASVILAQLNDVAGNGVNCFAGHCDWRLPDLSELLSIVNFSAPQVPMTFSVFHSEHCSPVCNDITNPECSCTDNFYWTSVSDAANENHSAWYVGFRYFGTDTVAKYLANDQGVRAVRSARSRFKDNGDGTVSDSQTGLMWEKKVDLDGVPNHCLDAISCPNPHDADNHYTFSQTGSDFDGTGATVFLAQLNDLNGNGRECFAGYCDWRIPEMDELVTLFEPNRLDRAYGDRPAVDAALHNALCNGACTDLAACSCTSAHEAYFSRTSAGDPSTAWFFYYRNANSLWPYPKVGPALFRAVRGRR